MRWPTNCALAHARPFTYQAHNHILGMFEYTCARGSIRRSGLSPSDASPSQSQTRAEEMHTRQADLRSPDDRGIGNRLGPPSTPLDLHCRSAALRRFFLLPKASSFELEGSLTNIPTRESQQSAAADWPPQLSPDHRRPAILAYVTRPQ
jgi:hypothetical protein